MKLSISNIAWENNELDEHIEYVGQLGLHGLEVAPSCVWDEPVETSKLERQELKDKINRNGLEVAGIHSLLYTRPDLQLFDTQQSREKAGEYLKQLFELCADLGGQTLVFGSPKNRGLSGKSYEECLDIAEEFFRSISSAAESCNVVLCLEPLSTKETDFITSSEDANSLVERVSHPGFGLQLDIKAIIDAGEDYKKLFSDYGQKIEHLHVGDTDLSPPGTAGFDHSLIGDVIRESGYEKFISIEMRRGFGPSKDVIKSSVEYVRRCYEIDEKVGV